MTITDSRHPRGMKSADTLREELAAGKKPSGLYGDAIGGKSFTDRDCELMRLSADWHSAWGTEWHSMTCYTTIEVGAAAKARAIADSREIAMGDINPAHQPALVRLADGMYDSFPLGHPLPAGATIEARLTGGRWRNV